MKSSILFLIFNIYCEDKELENEEVVAYCARQNAAYLVFKRGAKRFINKALKNDNFKPGLITLVKVLGKLRVKTFKKDWIKLVMAYALGKKEFINKFKDVNEVLFYYNSAQDFYYAMQLISQHIDFSNPLYRKIIFVLVDDLVLTINPPSTYVDEFSGLNMEGVYNIVRKAIFINHYLKEENIDRLNLKKIKADEINEIKAKINKIIEYRKTINLSDIVFDPKICFNNEEYSSLIFERDYKKKHCNSEWISCFDLAKYKVNTGSKTLSIPFFD